MQGRMRESETRAKQYLTATLCEERGELLFEGALVRSALLYMIFCLYIHIRAWDTAGERAKQKWEKNNGKQANKILGEQPKN